MKNLIISALIASPLISAHTVAKASDVAAGEAKSVVCAACHGAEGKADNPMYPNLSGQNKLYLVNALKAYRNDNRTGGNAVIMAPMAKMLTDNDIDSLAEYYSAHE